jgi:dipeptidyl aminopeptidase/acylaminoacyl peptidase
MSIFASASVQADASMIETFTEHPQFQQLKISPDGRYLAATVPVEGVNRLVFLDISNIDMPTQAGVLAPPSGESVAQVWWVNDERVVFTTSEVRGALELPRPTGRILAVNHDGKKRKEIWSLADYKKYPAIIDTIKDDDDHIVISHVGMNRESPIIERLNVYNGRTGRIAVSPLERGGVLLDSEQNVRVAVGRDQNLELQVMYRSRAGGKWQTLDNPLKGELAPVGVLGDDRTALFVSDASDTMGIHSMDLTSGELSPVAVHPKVEAGALLWSRDGNELIGVEFLSGKPEVTLTNADHVDNETWQRLLATFEGMHVRITSSTADGRIVIIQTSSDRQPATWYHYDTEAGRLKFLVSAHPDIDPDKMAPTESHWVTARDGTEIQVYVTKSSAADDGPSPTIMNIHGGPHGIRDSWAFQAEVQMLAYFGYTVIQPNYRGSGGFGHDFLESGYRKWYAEMQDDITDVTLWAFEQGIADEDKTCIYGGSYGGFAALAGLTKEPELYACGFAFAGVFDLELMYERGDTTESKMGRSYLETYLGSDTTDLRQRSPINHVQKIKAPLFIAHGKEDVRAHVEHFYALRRRLDAAGIPYQQLLVDREGHGFYNVENRALYARELLSFFDQHIGTRSEPAVVRQED